jgi:molybdopterin-guanine dinucleotide biosynthesis protein A
MHTPQVATDQGEDQTTCRTDTHEAYLSSLTGAVLAGGRSARLGQDKCGLVLGAENVDMLTRSARLMQRLLGEVVHIVGREHLEFPCILDEIPGKGPVGAVTALLRRVNRPCLVLSCDLPFMDEHVLLLLVKAWQGRKAGTLQTLFWHTTTGRRENLVAIYEPEALLYLEPNLQANLLKIELIIPDEFRCFVPVPKYAKGAFFNINTLDNLREARQCMANASLKGG